MHISVTPKGCLTERTRHSFAVRNTSVKCIYFLGMFIIFHASFFLFTLVSNSPLAATCLQFPCVEPENYLGSALIVFNLETRQVVFNTTLEVSKVRNIEVVKTS